MAPDIAAMVARGTPGEPPDLGRPAAAGVGALRATPERRAR